MRILQTIKLVNFENDSQDKMIAKASKTKSSRLFS